MKEQVLPALWEAVKEPLRWGVLAALPILITALANTGWSPEVIAIITIVLRVVDKILHDVGRSIENDTLQGGLTRF